MAYRRPLVQAGSIDQMSKCETMKQELNGCPIVSFNMACGKKPSRNTKKTQFRQLPLGARERALVPIT